MRPIVLIACVLVLSACDAADALDDLSSGSFQAQVSGAVTTTMQGEASFSVADGSDGFVVVMVPGIVDMLSLERAEQGRPSTGSYVIGDSFAGTAPGEFLGTLILVADDGVFQSTAGSLQITASSSSEVRGSFSFGARDDKGRDVTVSGAFAATCAADPGEGCN